MPFYTKEGESWVKWTGDPKNIEIADGKIQMLEVKDPEIDLDQTRIAIIEGNIVGHVQEGGGVIFPREGADLGLVNRRDVIFVNQDTGKMGAVIYSEKPVK